VQGSKLATELGKFMLRRRVRSEQREEGEREDVHGLDLRVQPPGQRRRFAVRVECAFEEDEDLEI